MTVDVSRRLKRVRIESMNASWKSQSSGQSGHTPVACHAAKFSFVLVSRWTLRRRHKSLSHHMSIWLLIPNCPGLYQAVKRLLELPYPILFSLRNVALRSLHEDRVLELPMQAGRCDVKLNDILLRVAATASRRMTGNNDPP